MADAEDRAVRVRNWALRATQGLVDLRPGPDVDPWLFMLTPSTQVASKLNRDQFEDPRAFATLCENVLPELVHRHQADAVALMIGAWGLAHVAVGGQPYTVWTAAPGNPDALIIQVVTTRHLEYLLAPVQKHQDKGNELGDWTLVAGALSPASERLQKCLRRLLN